jgi:DNA repair protein RecN (Recombination protein N)
VRKWGFQTPETPEIGPVLRRLQINNYALIHQAEVDFPGNLTVITGETGAGKSIFLDALGLALGRRADQSALANQSKKCVVEAEFVVGSLGLEDFFKAHELAFEDVVVLRRELSGDGRSRSLVNDAVVPLSAVKQLADRLIDIHSQHQTLSLNKSGFQLLLLDAFAGTTEKLGTYRAQYNRLQALTAELKKLNEDESNARKELDYFRFLFSELEEANLIPGELKRMEDESSALENAEHIRSSLLAAADGISGDQGQLPHLAGVKQSVQALARFGSVYAGLSERLNACYIELKDLASDLLSAGESLAPDQERLELINGRMDQMNRLLRKHGVNDEDSLIKVREEIESKLSGYDSMEARIASAEKERQKLLAECVRSAGELSAMRRKAIAGIEKKVGEMLLTLGMPNAQFSVNLESGEVPGSNGFDEVTFLFSANRGNAQAELQKVASGGELSRLMLALKALLAEKKKLPCIIFDEIDTGVSGEVADRIGNILLRMGSHMQVIAITHLPQLASKGGHHLFVYKEEDAKSTVSHIKELGSAERVTEIAKMLSRGKPTETALSNAKELLGAQA